MMSNLTTMLAAKRDMWVAANPDRGYYLLPTPVVTVLGTVSEPIPTYPRQTIISTDSAVPPLITASFKSMDV